MRGLICRKLGLSNVAFGENQPRAAEPAAKSQLCRRPF